MKNEAPTRRWRGPGYLSAVSKHVPFGVVSAGCEAPLMKAARPLIYPFATLCGEGVNGDKRLPWQENLE